MDFDDAPTVYTAYVLVLFEVLLLLAVGWTVKVMARNANVAKHAPHIAAAKASMPPLPPPPKPHVDRHAVFTRVKAMRPTSGGDVRLSDEELHAALRLTFGPAHPLPVRVIDQLCRKHVHDSGERLFSFEAFAHIVSDLEDLSQ
jgi:hypothetical protein